MAFLAAPEQAPGQRRRVTLADLAGANLLVTERGSGTRTTLERLYKDAGMPLHIGSELSSNEAIEQMCAAGFGAACLSLNGQRLVDERAGSAPGTQVRPAVAPMSRQCRSARQEAA